MFHNQSPAEFGYYFQIFKRAEVRKGMHVGNLTYNGGGKVNEHLQNVSSERFSNIYFVNAFQLHIWWLL